MTPSTELKAKYDASVEKVEKRKALLKKNCNQAGINFDALMDSYYKFVRTMDSVYLRSKDAVSIVSALATTEGRRYDDPVSIIIDSLPKLYDAERVSRNWKIKLDTQVNKENAPKIKVLVDFLDNWGERAKRFYEGGAVRYVDLLNEFHTEAYAYLKSVDVGSMSYKDKCEFVTTFNTVMGDKFNVKMHRSYRSVDAHDYADPKVEALTRDIANVRFEGYADGLSYDSIFGYNNYAGEYVLKSVDTARLDKVIADEKARKYDDLCERIGHVVGEITDCDGLHIGAKSGELNGIVVGTNGKARVETIGAGGYNIQVFHYRVLVHKLKD